tara:strand:- start:381 stop:1247 length:867 start_codon:yes stop_codon:yes gene_type:complete
VSLFGRIASIGAKIAPFVLPPGAGTAASVALGTVAAGEAKKEAKKKQARLAQERDTQMSEIFGSGSLNTIQPTVMAQPKQAGFFESLSNFGSRLGTGTLNVLENVLPGVITGKILGTGPVRTNQGPAVATTLNLGAQENAGSGSIQAGFGSALPGIVNFGSRLLRSPAGQIGFGTAVGGALSLMGPDGRQMRITRKMKSQARTVLNLTGGNISAAADILGIDDNTLVMILLKRFRNDGPVITKAALRKTRQTMRRLKSMCDMQSDLLPRTTRRRAPMKRATTTTLIKN